MFKKSVSIVLALVVVCALSNTRSYAEESHAVIPEPLPQVWKYGWSGDSKWDDAVFEGLKGNCALLKPIEALELGKWDYFRVGLISELIDRGICRPADPAKAAVYFKSAMDKGSPIYPRTILGWKYWHGHGVEKDLDKARQLFKEAVIKRAMMPSFFYDARVKRLFRGRTVPKPMWDGIAWLKAQHADEALRKKLAHNLARGTGSYFDGSTLVQSRWAAMNIFFSNQGDIDMVYAGVQEILAGDYSDDEKHSPGFYLDRNVDCRHLPSILLMADVREKGLLGYSRHPTLAYTLYKAAQRLGVDVTAHLNRITSQGPLMFSMTTIEEDVDDILNRTCYIPKAVVSP